MNVRPLARGELETAAATLTLAFEDDPLMRFMMPRAESRARWLRWFHLRALKECFAAGERHSRATSGNSCGTFTLETGPSEGAIAIHPPGSWPPSLGAELAAWPLPPGLPPWRLLATGVPLERRIHALHPAEAHLYVYVLGVHPSRKGRGLGGALLRHVTQIADAAGVACHLETANPDNLGLYRHFGFETRSELTSHGGPPLWTLTRDKVLRAHTDA